MRRSLYTTEVTCVCYVYLLYIITFVAVTAKCVCHQVALEVLPLSAWTRQLLMYQTVSAITLAGLTGVLTILYRKRHELEEIVAEERAAANADAGAAGEEPGTPDMHLPLLHTVPSDEEAPPSPLGNHTPRSTYDGSMRRVSSLSRLPSLAAFDFIDPAQSLPLWESEDREVAFQPGSIPEGHLLTGSREGSRRASMASGHRGGSFGGWGGRGLGSPEPHSWSPPGMGAFVVAAKKYGC